MFTLTSPHWAFESALATENNNVCSGRDLRRTRRLLLMFYFKQPPHRLLLLLLRIKLRLLNFSMYLLYPFHPSFTSAGYTSFFTWRPGHLRLCQMDQMCSGKLLHSILLEWSRSTLYALLRWYCSVCYQGLLQEGRGANGYNLCTVSQVEMYRMCTGLYCWRHCGRSNRSQTP